MKKIESNNGFGLAAFSLLLLVTALLIILIIGNSLFGVILAAVALILSVAALVEARRSNGAVRFAYISLIIASLGTILAFYLLGGIEEPDYYKPNSTNSEVIQSDTSSIIDNAGFGDLEKKLEELESDSAN